MQGDPSPYWTKARRRISRRRLLASGATAGVGAAALAAVGCGDDDDDDDADTAASGTAGPSATTTAGEAKPGGSIRYAASNPVHLDPTLNASFAAVAIHRETYNRLFRPLSGPGEDPGSLRLIHGSRDIDAGAARRDDLHHQDPRRREVAQHRAGQRAAAHRRRRGVHVPAPPRPDHRLAERLALHASSTRSNSSTRSRSRSPPKSRTRRCSRIWHTTTRRGSSRARPSSSSAT